MRTTGCRWILQVKNVLVSRFESGILLQLEPHALHAVQRLHPSTFRVTREQRYPKLCLLYHERTQCVFAAVRVVNIDTLDPNYVHRS